MSTVAGLSASPSIDRTAGRRKVQREHWFFSALAIVAALTVLWGFAPSFYLRGASDMPSLSPLLTVHGTIFTTWIALLIAQTMLVANGQTRVHRKLGVAGGVLMVVMVVIGYMAGIDAAHRGSALPGMTPEGFLIVPMMSIAVFAVLGGAAIALRRRTDYHKRLIMLATANLVTAAIARIPAVGAGGPPAFFGVTDLFVVALVAYDVIATRRVHPATVVGSLVLIASQPAQLMLANTAGWLSVATWLTR